MTIQTINIGSAPNDDTGDDPRTVGQKLNSNFQTSSHAASREVGIGAGELMEVGAFGLGADAVGGWPTSDVHDSVPSGEYYSSSALNMPEAAGYIDVTRRSSDYATMTFVSAVGGGKKYNKSQIAGAWQVWREIYDDANMQPAEPDGLLSTRILKNNTGAVISAGASLAGSGLNAVVWDASGNFAPLGSFTGTWKNISGLTIQIGGFGQFVRI